MVEDRSTGKVDRAAGRHVPSAGAWVRPLARARRGLGRVLAGLAVLAVAGAMSVGAAAAAEPPAEVTRLLEAPPLPRLSQGPNGRYALLVHERELLPAAHLAEPTVSVVGLKINPRTYGRHAPIAYFGLTLVELAAGRKTELELPSDAVIGFPMWSADGSRFAFTVTVNGGIELWVGKPSEGRVRRLVGAELHASLNAPCTWMPDGRRLLCRMIDGEKRDIAPASSGADSLFRLTAPTTMRSLAQQSLDPAAIRHLLESQLTLIDAETGLRLPVGAPTAIETVEPAPSGAFLLVSRIVPPYPRAASVEEPLRAIEVWNRLGKVIKTFPAAGSRPNTPRALQWHASMPATLVWVARHGADDRLMMQPAPFDQAPSEVFRTPNSYAGLEWLEGRRDALVSEYDGLRRLRRHWLVPFGDDEPRLLAEDSVDAAHSRFGRPVRTTNRQGKQVVNVHDGGIFLRGSTAAAEGIVSYLDHLRLESLQTRRVWESDGSAHEVVLDVLSPDGGRLLTSRETAREPPNYYVHDESGARPLTAFEHPAPALKGARRIPLRYERPDGLRLSANLYLPEHRDSAGPLPVVLWAYPRVYGEDTQAVEPATAEQFPGFERAFKLFFLLQGYAVLDDVSMPVIGNASTANDTFIEQIVTNANATIQAAARTGFIDPERVAVAGHSYGAFMVANLLAHTDLFEAGAALSGAYNRTLTPFGFQTERRSLWEARETYLSMSPFLYSNLINEPLLLVHGLLDENAGTPPMQSIQFYEAIRHNGGNAEILLLPREGHSYRGRESVLATAATMLEFFDAHLKRRDAPPAPETLRASNVAAGLD